MWHAFVEKYASVAAVDVQAVIGADARTPQSALTATQVSSGGCTPTATGGFTFTDVTVSQPPSAGTVTVNPDGSVTYLPGDAAPGTYTFDVTRTDENGQTTTVTYQVTVLDGPADPAPTPSPTGTPIVSPPPGTTGTHAASTASKGGSFATGGSLFREVTPLQQWSAAGAGLLTGAVFLALARRRQRHHA
ncbi:MAG: Ig-like domain-containing protein [Micrococcales bacterium]|nr:Ig-like domain-containing protein [Micrococcales bacterium]